MSYDLYLRDPVDRSELSVPAHTMFGGNIPCKRGLDGTLIPDSSTRAYLNITYNYSKYYYDAFRRPKDDMTAEELEEIKNDYRKYGITDLSGGIRCLNGMSGVNAVPFLKEMIHRIESKYKDEDGNWITTQREMLFVVDKRTGRRCDSIEKFRFYTSLKKDGHDEDEAKKLATETFVSDTEIVDVYEGGGANDYWLPTAANAIRPLYQLIALSRLRPDGVWSEES